MRACMCACVYARVHVCVRHCARECERIRRCEYVCVRASLLSRGKGEYVLCVLVSVFAGASRSVCACVSACRRRQRLDARAGLQRAFAPRRALRCRHCCERPRERTRTGRKERRIGDRHRAREYWSHRPKRAVRRRRPWAVPAMAWAPLRVSQRAPVLVRARRDRAAAHVRAHQPFARASHLRRERERDAARRGATGGVRHPHAPTRVRARVGLRRRATSQAPRGMPCGMARRGAAAHAWQRRPVPRLVGADTRCDTGRGRGRAGAPDKGGGDCDVEASVLSLLDDHEPTAGRRHGPQV